MTGPDETPSAGVDTERHHYDWSANGDPMYAIVSAVADVTDRDPRDVPPLNDQLDPDALETLLKDGKVPGNNGTEVSFNYDTVMVTIEDDGTLELRPSSG